MIRVVFYFEKSVFKLPHKYFKFVMIDETYWRVGYIIIWNLLLERRLFNGTKMT